MINEAKKYNLQRRQLTLAHRTRDPPICSPFENEQRQPTTCGTRFDLF